VTPPKQGLHPQNTREVVQYYKDGNEDENHSFEYTTSMEKDNENGEYHNSGKNETERKMDECE